MPRKPPPPETQSLVVSIESFEQSYFISENRGHRSPVSDEELIEIVGRIERITPKLKAHASEHIAVTFACSQSFPGDESVAVRDTPALLTINLSKRQRSLMAYLPATAFWSLPRLIETGQITHIDANFAPIRYGNGDLQSLHLIGPARAAELLASEPFDD